MECWRLAVLSKSILHFLSTVKHMFLYEIASKYLSYEARLLVAILSSAGSTAILYKCKGLRPGWSRIPASLLTAACNFLVPSIFNADSELVTMAILGLNNTWLSTFKVVSRPRPSPSTLDYHVLNRPATLRARANAAARRRSAGP